MLSVANLVDLVTTLQDELILVSDLVMKLFGARKRTSRRDLNNYIVHPFEKVTQQRRYRPNERNLGYKSLRNRDSERPDSSLYHRLLNQSINNYQSTSGGAP